MAANYIANFFKEIGIPPYKNNSYFQKFKVKTVKRLVNGNGVKKCFRKDLIIIISRRKYYWFY